MLYERRYSMRRKPRSGPLTGILVLFQRIRNTVQKLENFALLRSRHAIDRKDTLASSHVLTMHTLFQFFTDFLGEIRTSAFFESDGKFHEVSEK